MRVACFKRHRVAPQAGHPPLPSGAHKALLLGPHSMTRTALRRTAIAPSFLGGAIRIWQSPNPRAKMLFRSVNKPASALLAKRMNEAPGNGLGEHLVPGIEALGCQSALNFDPRSARNSDPCVRDLAE
jgi:hypothetical protein